MSNPQEKPGATPEGQPAQPGAGRSGPAGQGQVAGASATGTAGGTGSGDATRAAGGTRAAGPNGPADTRGAAATGARGAAATGVREQEADRYGQPEESAGRQPGMEPAPRYGAEPGMAGAVGGALCVVTGLLTFFAGLSAVVRSNYYPVLSGYAYQWNTHNWGWALVGLGIVLFGAGACALLGMRWARAVGVGLAVVSAVGGFLFLAYTPFWGVIIVALSLFTIWGLLHDNAASRRHA